MRKPRAWILPLLLLATALPAIAGGLYCAAGAALDSKSPDESIRMLRSAGPAGLEQLLATFEQRDRSLDSLTARETEILDGVCAMRDCAASRLYWHTDLEAALVAAQSEGKPILSLRLLGRLDEEMSCANSRYFRTALYPDPEVARRLRDDFILHWRSVRAVPVVTIEFEDGRKLRAPVTGNSIHYVLDSRGRLVEPIPGLYAASVFAGILDRAAEDATRLAVLDDRDFSREAIRRSGTMLAELESALVADYQRLNNLGRERLAAGKSPWELLSVPGVLRDRINAGGNTMSKVAFESPVTAAFDSPSAAPGPWNDLALVYLEASRLAEPSRELIASKQGVDGEEAERLIAGFEWNIARDTVFNQYRFRRALLGWLAEDPVIDGLEAFNSRAYERLFDSPLEDAWMGFSPRETYAALPQGGRTDG